MFKLEIATNNDAFAADPAAEIARILRKVLGEVEQWDGTDTYQAVRDVNDNRVGGWMLEADPDEVGDTEPCEECGNDIPVAESDEVNRYHDESCSLFPGNVVGPGPSFRYPESPEDEEAADLLAASEHNPDLAFTSDGSNEPERPQG